MKTSVLITVGILAAQAEDLTLESVYGPVTPVDELTPFFRRSNFHSRNVRPSEFYQLRTKDNCHFPLEVLLIQDATNSFQDDIDIMRDTQLKEMIAALQTTHPGTEYSVMTFRDKPITPLGTPETDFCYQFKSSLNNDTLHLEQVYADIKANGGGDPPENQFGALLAGTASQQPGWSNPLATRLVVVSTDAPPHFADDGKNAPGLPPFSGTFADDKYDQMCLKEYYPAPEVIKNSIFQREAYAAFLVFDPDWMNGLPARSWKWFNSYIQQPDEFVNALANDSSNFWEVLSKVIEQIEDAECQFESTTTTTPATTKTVTTTTGTTTVATTQTSQSVTTQPSTYTTETVTGTTGTTTVATTQTSQTVTTQPSTYTTETVTGTTGTTTAATTQTSQRVTTQPSTYTTETVTGTTGTTTVATTRTSQSVTTQPSTYTSTTKATSESTIPPSEKPCPCPNCCPEVVIKLAKRPKTLHLDVNN